jgi:hypothetical protein
VVDEHAPRVVPVEAFDPAGRQVGDGVRRIAFDDALAILLCVPVRIAARLGEQREFVTKQLSKRNPFSAISSIRGVVLTTEP